MFRQPKKCPITRDEDFHWTQMNEDLHLLLLHLLHTLSTSTHPWELSINEDDQLIESFNSGDLLPAGTHSHSPTIIINVLKILLHIYSRHLHISKRISICARNNAYPIIIVTGSTLGVYWFSDQAFNGGKIRLMHYLFRTLINSGLYSLDFVLIPKVTPRYFFGREIYACNFFVFSCLWYNFHSNFPANAGRMPAAAAAWLRWKNRCLIFSGPRNIFMSPPPTSRRIYGEERGMPGRSTNRGRHAFIACTAPYVAQGASRSARLEATSHTWPPLPTVLLIINFQEHYEVEC